MNISIENKTALVTGGNSGIGRAISLALARYGADVALTYFSTTSNETIDQIKALGKKCLAVKMDATKSDEVNEVVKEAAVFLNGHIDILVNNVGNLISRCLIEEMSDDLWKSVIEINLSSAFYCTRAVLPYMNTGWGRIINISSLSAHTGGAGGATAYGSAKAGMLGLTRGLAKEFASRGITVNAVNPGMILETAFHSIHTNQVTINNRIAQTPLRRGGVPDDVAASDLGSFVTGVSIEVNGGYYFS